MICCHRCCTINKHSHIFNAIMFDSKKKKEERKERKKRKKPPKHRFQSICVFGESNVGREEEFIVAANELANILIARKINFVYGGGIQGLRGRIVLSVSRKGSQILSICIKKLDRHIFTIGYDL